MSPPCHCESACSSHASHALRPGLTRQALLDPFHRDTGFHRTDELAQIATYTFAFIDARDALRRRLPIPRLHGVELGYRGNRDLAAVPLGQVNALVGAVPAGDITKIAPDALVGVNARDDLIVQVEILPIGDLWQGEAAKIVDRAETFLVHPVAQAVDHVFHNAKAVVQHRGAYLQ